MLGIPTTPPAADTTRALALAAVSLAVLTWGFSNVVPKVISTTGLVISFYRLWFAIPLLWLLPAIVPSMRRNLGRDTLGPSLIGGALFAVHQVLFFTSLKLTSVANVAILAALQPVLVLLVSSRLLGERASAGAVGWSVVAVIGTGLVVAGSAGGSSRSLTGDLLATLNLFAFTAYFLASKQFRRHIGALEYVVGMTTVSGIIILIIAVLTGQEFGSPQGEDWWLLLFLALLPGTLGQFLTNWAHPHLPAFLVSVILLAVPVIAAAAAWMFLSEPLALLQMAGGAVVLVAIGTLVTRPERVEEKLAEAVAETDAP